MAYNTGNPSGSSDPRDLSDSSADIDTWATSTATDTHPDRLGVSRKTWHGMENEFEADQAVRASEFEADQDSREAQFVQLMVSGGYTGTGVDGAVEEYAAGITVSAYKEIIRDGGEFWRAAAGTTLPYTTTGAGMPESGAFVSVGDAVLRQELVQPVATFNSVADMKASAMLDVGRKARTLGYYAPGDGGGNDYEIVPAGTGTADGYSYIDLPGSGLQAFNISQPLDNAALLQLRKLQMQSGANIEVVCFGDSITAGVGAATTSYPAQLQGMLQTFYDNANINLTNRGVSGDNSQDLLDRYDAAMASNPHIVLLMIGMNDSFPGGPISTEQYAENLHNLITKMKLDGIAILIGDITPRKRANNDGPNRADAYRRSLKDVADYHNIEVLPMNEAMTNLTKSTRGYAWKDISSDGIHYTDLGYTHMAGAWLAYGLSTDSLVMNPGERRDTTKPLVFGFSSPTVAYELVEDSPSKMMETSILRYTGNANIGQQIRSYLWVDNYAPCDLVIYATRENHATLNPAILVNNTSVEEEGAKNFTLGLSGGLGEAVYGVPLRACQLRPGFNEIRMRCEDGETAEIATFAVIERDQRIVREHGLFNERYAGGVFFSDGVNNTSAPLSLGSTQSVAPGATVDLGVISNSTYAGIGTRKYSRYVLRGKLVDGLRLDFGQSEYPGAEYESAGSVRFVDNGDGTISMNAYVHWNTGDELIDSNTFSTNFAGDWRLLIQSEVDGLEVYLGGSAANVVKIPFVVGPCNVLAKNVGTSTALLNSLKALSPEQGPFDEFEGDNWIDFSTQSLVYVIGGVEVSMTLA